jgi:hypothetical protein
LLFRRAVNAAILSSFSYNHSWVRYSDAEGGSNIDGGRRRGRMSYPMVDLDGFNLTGREFDWFRGMMAVGNKPNALF